MSVSLPSLRLSSPFQSPNAQLLRNQPLWSNGQLDLSTVGPVLQMEIKSQLYLESHWATTGATETVRKARFTLLLETFSSNYSHLNLKGQSIRNDTLVLRLTNNNQDLKVNTLTAMESWHCIDHFKVAVSCKIPSYTRLLSSPFNKAISLAETAHMGTFNASLEKQFWCIYL